MSGSLFNTMEISRGGLHTAQVQVDVTGKNVANANDEYYTRQRAISRALPKDFANGRHVETGGGFKSVDIQRMFNEYIYDNYRDSLSTQEYSKFIKDTLKQISSFFPELEGHGLANELKNYFNAWSNLTTNPNEPASKITLIRTASSLAKSLQTTREDLTQMQDTLNKKVKAHVGEINSLAKEIATINKEILTASEDQKISNKSTYVNELRDRRDELELAMARITSMTVGRKGIATDNRSSTSIAESSDNYIMNIGGFNIIDGVDYSTILVKADSLEDDLYNIKFLRRDEKEFTINSSIQNGKLGALLKLRGSSLDAVNREDGYIQEYIKELDKFSQGLIHATNSIFAKTKSSSFISNLKDVGIGLSKTDLLSHQLNIQTGSFFVNMFDLSDKFIGQKEIFINKSTTMEDILEQFNSNTDDNFDGSSQNDISDKFQAQFINNTFSINQISGKNKYSLSIDDKNTNFAGGLSLKKFFVGDSAKNIAIDFDIKDKPEDIQAYILTKDGKKLLSNDMTQLQHKEINFYEKNKTTNKISIGDYFNNIISTISNDTKIAIENHKTRTTLFEAIKTEFTSMGKVNTDEELINLMKFQAGYVANAKVLTTIDEMLNTLLGLKQ